MANLSTKIKIWCANNGVADVDFMKDVMLQDDMVDGVSNPYIKEWNLDIAQPTESQLNGVENEANKLEKNNIVIAKRKNLYNSWDKQLEEINEQGLDAWKERIAQIKTDNPKE
tara:strand:+ start:540 stop:878 length:339 start_codon:yes stop_codon:yes gene_type:complete